MWHIISEQLWNVVSLDIVSSTIMCITSAHYHYRLYFVLYLFIYILKITIFITVII